MRISLALPLFAALTLGTLGSFAAATPSTSTDYDNATVTAQSTQVGSLGQAVSFDVSTGTVSLNAAAVNGFLKPGETYTITIPVTNTTDRTITLKLDGVNITSGTASVAGVQAGDAVTLQEGTTGELSISVTMAGAGTVTANTSVDVSYSVNGTAVY